MLTNTEQRLEVNVCLHPDDDGGSRGLHVLLSVSADQDEGVGDRAGGGDDDDVSEEVGGGHLTLLRDLTDPAPDGGVGDGLLVVVPEDVLRRLRTFPDQTREVHGESFLQVYIRSTKNLSEGL